MGKDRKSKRQLVRDEKRQKKRQREIEHEDKTRENKRQRKEDREGRERDHPDDIIPFERNLDGGEDGDGQRGRGIEREFFGMLAEEEQEYFRHADELLELNDFPTEEERDIFLQNVYKEAEGKEMKLASSQSCSRLMERLILLSNTKQKKHLFEQFATHFLSMVTHRFASHCCEKLFLQSAPAVTQELSGGEEQEQEEAIGTEQKAPVSMEHLFLLTLDELEAHLSYLLSDKYASHTLRVLLVVLSGRPLNEVSTKSLLQSKKKEHITVQGASLAQGELNSQVRAVPESFTLAIRKIITDSTARMDATALRVLAKHPTGNPVLQLLLELDIQLNAKKKESKSDETESTSLMDKLVPGAPASFADQASPASDFINTMIYDPIGSRLLEALITHAPGKIFKGLQLNFFNPRIHNYLRNEVACYPAMKVLSRLNKDDLVDALGKSLPSVPLFIEKGRLSVVKIFFERLQARNSAAGIESLLEAVIEAVDNDPKSLVPRLCMLNAEDAEKKKEFQQDEKNQSVLANHGSNLIVAMLRIPGAPATAVQESLLSLSSDQVFTLATSSAATSNVLTTALGTASEIRNFHKILVSALAPHVGELSSSQHGHNVLNAIIAAPSKGDGIAVPFHMKEVIIAQLTEREKDLRESWVGRNVWRTWKGDVWRHRRQEWIRWAKEADPEAARVAAIPRPRRREWDENAPRNGKTHDRAPHQKGRGVAAA